MSAAAEALDNSNMRLSASALYWSRFWGMFVKKAIHTMRNRIISTVQLALPVIFTIAALTVDKVKFGLRHIGPDHLGGSSLTRGTNKVGHVHVVPTLGHTGCHICCSWTRL